MAEGNEGGKWHAVGSAVLSQTFFNLKRTFEAKNQVWLQLLY